MFLSSFAHLGRRGVQQKKDKTTSNKRAPVSGNTMLQFGGTINII